MEQWNGKEYEMEQYAQLQLTGVTGAAQSGFKLVLF